MAASRDMSALDYLIEKRQPADAKVRSGPPSVSPVAKTALHAAAAGQVLSTSADIERERGGDHPGALLSEIDSRLQIGAELLIPVVRLLTSAGLLEVAEERPFDDNRITVTDDGRRLLAPGQQVEMFRRLGLTV